MEVKYQKVSYRRYFTEVNYKKETYRGYFTEVKYLKVGNLGQDANTPRAPSGPERI